MQALEDTGEDSAAAATSGRLGTVVGDGFLLTAVLGSGGAATVYRAVGREGQGVAVKVLHAQYAVDPNVRARFAREARVANLIPHHGVVRVLADGETDDGAPFLVMELLEGETLEARWARKGKKLPVAEVLYYADKVLDVLVAAHEKGVVHRDLKPENLFLTTARDVKVLDFGVARLRAEAANADPMTQAGSLMGTLAFMPPEQARGDADAVGVQTDLWAVGATMFTFLTGKLVHPGEEFWALLNNATKRAPPSLATVAPELPNALVELVDFALSFDVSKRWANAKTMQRAVREVHAILEAKSAREASVHWKASPNDSAADIEPVSDPMLEAPSRLDSIDPPPMSRGRTTETLPPAARRSGEGSPDRVTVGRGLDGAAEGVEGAPSTGRAWRFVAVALVFVVALLAGLYAARNR